MRASDKMAARVLLHERLTVVDRELALILSQEPSNRASAVARGLLNSRSDICDELIKVGFWPWLMPVDPAETKVGFPKLSNWVVADG